MAIECVDDDDDQSIPNSMKTINLSAALIFGLSIPLLTQTIAPPSSLAQTNNYPNGLYGDREWIVDISYTNNTYHYRGYKRRSNDSIELSGATVSRDRQRKYYIWNNGGTRYRVTWNPQDPNFIRLQVKTPNGKEVLNRRLSGMSRDEARDDV